MLREAYYGFIRRHNYKIPFYLTGAHLIASIVFLFFPLFPLVMLGFLINLPGIATIQPFYVHPPTLQAVNDKYWLMPLMVLLTEVDLFVLSSFVVWWVCRDKKSSRDLEL